MGCGEAHVSPQRWATSTCVAVVTVATAFSAASTGTALQNPCSTTQLAWRRRAGVVSELWSMRRGLLKDAGGAAVNIRLPTFGGIPEL